MAQRRLSKREFTQTPLLVGPADLRLGVSVQPARRAVFPRVPEISDERLDRLYIEHHRLYYHLTEERDLKSATIIRQLTKFKQGVILDIACGCGGFTYQLAKVFHDAQVIGVDIDEAAIAVASETYGKLAANLNFAVSDAHALEKHYSNVDLVTILDSLHHFDLEAVLAPIAQALKPGGYFFFEDFNRKEIYQHCEEKTVRAVYDLRAKHTDKECLNILSQSGSCNMQLLMLLSFMAAYTSSEVKQALAKQGFEGEVGEPARGIYVGLVTKKEAKVAV